MYVSMSRLRVAPERSDALIAAFRRRAHLVDDADGFIDLQVWRSDRDREEVLMVVNLDPDDAQEATLALDLSVLGVPQGVAFVAVDELTGSVYRWDGPHPYVRLDPSSGQVGHILRIELAGGAAP